MKKSKYLLIPVLILSAIFLGACNLPQRESSEDADATTVASTAETVLTQAAETAISTLSSATTAPETTALPTNTLVPTMLSVTATKTPVPCNRASFVKDVTYADNTEVPAGTTFTKTWRLKNNGSCTWTSGYVLLFDGGDQMGAPATSTVTGGTVAPGETVDISVNLTAPANPGTYQGKFKLRSPNNVVFGINAGGQGSFWVKIVVPNPTPTPTNTSFPTLPPPPPPLHSSGTMDILSSYLADLDEGLSSSDQDFWFEGVTAIEKYITPKNGALFVDWGFASPDLSQCTGASVSGNKIALSNAVVNHYICYKTNQGRIGKFKITAYNGNILSIDYMTWE